jgi:hypothetical protein
LPWARENSIYRFNAGDEVIIKGSVALVDLIVGQGPGEADT